MKYQACTAMVKTGRISKPAGTRTIRVLEGTRNTLGRLFSYHCRRSNVVLRYREEGVYAPPFFYIQNMTYCLYAIIRNTKAIFRIF